MRLQETHMIFNCWFAFRFPWWWKDNRIIEGLQIWKGWLQYKFIFAVFGNCCFQIVWDKIFRNSPIIRQCMYCASNKMWKFLIQKDLCINKTAKTKCSRKKYELFRSSPVVVSSSSSGWSPTQSYEKRKVMRRDGANSRFSIYFFVFYFS